MSYPSLYYLKKLKRKYLVIRLIEILLISLAVSAVIFGFTLVLPIIPILRIALPSFAAPIIFVVGFLRLNLHNLDEPRLISFLNQHYPAFQQSADLLFKDSVSLTSVQQIQKEIIKAKFPIIFRTIKFPHQMGKAISFFTLSMVFTFIMSSFNYNAKLYHLKKNKHKLTHSIASTIRHPASVKEIFIKVNPPLYTGLASYSTKDLNLTFPEGSQVTWSCVFSDSVQNPQLIFLHGDTIKFQQSLQNYTVKKTFIQSSIYQLTWETPSGALKSSAFYKITIIHDQPPKITVARLQQFAEINLNKNRSLHVNASLIDDYNIMEAYLIATVSKGNGESVKFREEKILFTSPRKLTGRSVQASRIIDLLELGLEPGDEMYFYVEALDNKTPLANRARTETFFISLQDTASQNLLIDAGPGVNLMPDYFRSQRQIIIDSEKLLKEKKGVDQKTFNSRSNELGYDQKLLRLKYGEFLGEEFETTIGPGAGIPANEGDKTTEENKENIFKQYSHNHDKGNEHNLVPEKKSQAGVNTGHEGNEDPAESYKHAHDNIEEATFFTQSIRNKLKAALSVMWDAELYLRMSDPKKSLPYQYTALRLLKEISNDSRIYVHKTGFDPPPLKEETRLSGDLTAIKSTRYETQIHQKKVYPAIRNALILVEKKLQQPEITFTIPDKQALLQAGNDLATLALMEPGNFLQALSLIKSIHEHQPDPGQLKMDLLQIRKALWKALPEESMSPAKARRSAHILDSVFIRNLESLKNE